MLLRNVTARRNSDQNHFYLLSRVWAFWLPGVCQVECTAESAQMNSKMHRSWGRDRSPWTAKYTLGLNRFAKFFPYFQNEAAAQHSDLGVSDLLNGNRFAHQGALPWVLAGDGCVLNCLCVHLTDIYSEHVASCYQLWGTHSWTVVNYGVSCICFFRLRVMPPTEMGKWNVIKIIIYSSIHPSVYLSNKH